MKMAAAEALYDTEAAGAVLALHHRQPGRQRGEVRDQDPRACCRSSATGTLDGEVEGINDLRDEYQETYGQDPGAATTRPATTRPIIPVTYWSFRLMIGLGAGRRVRRRCDPLAHPTGRVADRRGAGSGWRSRCRFLPLLANSFGWIFTEMGRQPWVVFGLMTTANGVSPGVSAGRGADLADRRSPCSTACSRSIEVGLIADLRPSRGRPVRASRRTRRSAATTTPTARSRSPTETEETRSWSSPPSGSA